MYLSSMLIEHFTEMIFCSRLEGNHSAEKRSLEQEAEELRAQAAQMANQLHCLQTELDSQREANVRAPSQTMKNLVDSLKAQLCLKEKQQRVVNITIL